MLSAPIEGVRCVLDQQYLWIEVPQMPDDVTQSIAPPTADDAVDLHVGWEWIEQFIQFSYSGEHVHVVSSPGERAPQEAGVVSNPAALRWEAGRHQTDLHA